MSSSVDFRTGFTSGLDRLKKMNPKFKEIKIENHEILMKQLDMRPSPCSERMKRYILKNSERIDYQKLSELVRDQFYNIDVMKTMSCLVYSLLNNERDYLDHLKLIDKLESDPEELIILFTNFFSGKNRLLTFKYDGEDTLEEGMTGLLALNSLREKIPTFSWIYGYTKCNMPAMIDDEIITVCRKEAKFGRGDYIGLISEYIPGGMTINDWVVKPSTNIKDLLSVLLTIFVSLRYANTKFEFVHWDLHTKNVMLRPLNGEYYIKVPDMEYYVWVGSNLATIIDYGFSTYKKNNRVFTASLRPDLGINPYASVSSFNDAFKLLNGIYLLLKNEYKNAQKFSSSNSSRGNNTLEKLNVIETILSQITGVSNTSDLFTLMREMGQNYSIFSNVDSNESVDKYVKITFEDLINLIIKLDLTDSIYTNVRPKNVLFCSDKNCLDESGIEKKILTRDKIVTLNDAMSIAQKIQKDSPELRNFINEYLERIDMNLDPEQYKKKSIIYIFNKFRIMDEELRMLQDIASLVENDKLVQQIGMLQEKLDQYIKTSYDQTRQAINHPIVGRNFKDSIYAPESRKADIFFDLRNDFKNLYERSMRKKIRKSLDTEEDVEMDWSPTN
jgi:hypothetical protein